MKDADLERIFYRFMLTKDGKFYIEEAVLADIQKDDVFIITEPDGTVIKDGTSFVFRATSDPDTTYLGFWRVEVEGF